MTPELISRVDAWISARLPLWPLPAGSGARRSSDLAFRWHCDSQRWRTFAAGTGKSFLAAESAGLRGVLLALVREAWGCENLYVRPADARGGWIAADIVRGRVCPQTFSSEDDALVAALEAAPEVPG